MGKPYLVISCSFTSGVTRYLDTLVSSGVINQVQPICFMYDPYFDVPKEFTVYKQGTKYLGNKAARLPLLKLMEENVIKSYDWIIWTDCQDIVFQDKLPNDACTIDTSAFVCPENTLHKDTSFWKPILEASDEFRCLLNEPVYNSGCFAMTGKAIKSYFDALSVPSYPNRYGPYGYDGDQLIFNKWILEHRKDCASAGDFFGCLYASYTGSEWRDGNFVVTSDKEKQTIDINNGKFINKATGKVISIIHAPGSSKQILDKVYPIKENKNNVEYIKESDTMENNTENVKYGAVLVVYNEEPTIAYCIKSIYDHVDKIVITTSDYTWSGIQQPLDQTVNIIKSYPDVDHKIMLVKGRWPRDDYARNDALNILEEAGCHYSLIIDGDELWDSKDIMKLKLAAASSGKDVFRCSWYTYWKDISFRIDPPENFRPVVMVNTKNIRFSWVREVCYKDDLALSNRTLQDTKRIGYDHKALFDCGDKVFLHHLSWVRNDEDARAKIEKSPHISEFVPNWYENVWLAWNNNTAMENLHPTYPPQFKRAVQVNKSEIPEVVKKYDIQITVRSEEDRTVIGVVFLEVDRNAQQIKTQEQTNPEKSIVNKSLDELKRNGRVSKETVINYFTDKFPECKYLEIGSQRRDNFLKINAWIKHDCEENPIGTTPHFHGSSNDFFAKLEKLRLNSVYDVIFIDGWHKCEQVLKDIINASKHLSENGFIVIHDCLPKEYKDQLREITEENKGRWLGDCYRAVAYLVKYISKDQVHTLLNTDQGCAVIKGKIKEFEIPSKEDMCNEFTWKLYIQEKETVMNCISWEDFIKN